jgi:hypothetical protein
LTVDYSRVLYIPLVGIFRKDNVMQTETQPTITASARNGGLRRSLASSRAVQFVRHYIEMVVAMFLGMFALGLPLAALLGVVGVDVSAWQHDARELLLLGMAFTMSVPMAAWMRYRGHGWAPVWEMTGSMFVPSFAAIGLLWAGITADTDALLYIQHIGMFPSMLAVMLFRLDEYTGHSGHAHAGA